ncbi:hypothetical protein [Carnimonas bestiolae]|uniref:hypothetical protein n=1 Tax=Carnimonas bestiolae TaxID=3402172 RepID=UPI003EDB902B
MTQTHVQMISVVNADQIKKETIDGEDHYRIPSATLPDNVVMNGGLYPADEIAKSFASLEGTPAPLGHPKIDGKYVPAGSQRAMNKYSVGAWNENVRREGGRVFLDKVVNIRVANQTVQGKALIKAIEQRDPIHTSTGIMLEREPATNAKDGFKWVARNMRFDHDAILLGEIGAATPEQGVGIFVNAEGEESDVLIGNVSLTDSEQESVNFNIEQIAKQIELAGKREDPTSVIGRLFNAFKSVIGGGESSESLAANHQEAPEGEAMTKEELEAVLNTALEPIKTELAEVKAVNAELKANHDSTKAAEQERIANERKPFEERAKAKGLTNEQVKGMETNTLKAAFPEEKPGYHVNTNFAGNSGKDEYALPE